MNILILNPPNRPPTEASILIEPVDTLTVATWLKHQGHQVLFLDLDRYGIEPLKGIECSFNLIVLIYDYYIPLHTTAALETFDEVFSILAGRAECLLVGGRIATYQPNDLLSRFQEIDGCIQGEIEPVLSDFLASNDHDISRIPGIVTRQQQADQPFPKRPQHPTNIYLEGFPISGPIADRSLCRLDGYIDVRSIIASRGCTGVCNFCSTVQYWGSWRGAPPEMVVAEMRHLERIGAAKILFLDDSFADNSARATEICNLLQQRPVNAAWGCLCRIENVSPELLRRMAAVGCRWIHFGIEHGTADVRARLGKRFTNDQVLEIIHFAKQLGVRIRTSWILDLPGSTLDSIRSTLNFARKVGSEEIKLHFLALRPGSTLYRNAKRMPTAAPSSKKAFRRDDIFIHSGRPHSIDGQQTDEQIFDALAEYRNEMSVEGYQWVDDVTFWRRFDVREAERDERFLSTVITRYGLGWL